MNDHIILVDEITSRRFNLAAGRLVNTSVPFEEILSHAASNDIRFLTARVDVQDLATVHKLESSGFRLMDTLVTYCRDERSPALTGSKEEDGLSVRSATQGDAPVVSSIAQAAFKGYIGHFHADQNLDSKSSDDVYVDWASNSVKNLSSRNPVLICSKDGQEAGFLCLQGLGDELSEITLNAVHPDFQRGGIYTLLLSRAISLSVSNGSRFLRIATQVNNYAVQRIWSRHGFFHQQSQYTFHRWF